MRSIIIRTVPMYHIQEQQLVVTQLLRQRRRLDFEHTRSSDEANILQQSIISNTSTHYAMSFYQSSHGDDRHDARCTQQQHQQHNSSLRVPDSRDTQRHRHPGHIRARYGAAAELTQMIDDHTATWQSLSERAQIGRPVSQGTMIVDWDGSMNPKVHYRRKSQEEIAMLNLPPLRPLPLAIRRGVVAGNTDNEKQSHTASVASKQKPLPLLPTNRHTPAHVQIPEQSNYTPSNPASPPHSPWHDSVISEAQSLRRRHALHIQTSTKAPPGLLSSFTQTPIYDQHRLYTRPNGSTVAYHSPRISPTTGVIRPGYVKGYDATERLEYDYDGRLVHIHRGADQCLSPRSIRSDYYAVDVDKYSADAQPSVKDKAAGSSPAGQGGKRNSVIRFVDKVLFKLDGMGLMKKLREERKSDKKKQSWREAGYYD
jgi:hypothetical protein